MINNLLPFADQGEADRFRAQRTSQYTVEKIRLMLTQVVKYELELRLCICRMAIINS